MSIKRKDGSPYTLIGPNPIMKTQSLWDDDDNKLVATHNLNYEEVVIEVEVKKAEPKLEIIESEQEAEIPEFEDIEKIEPQEIEVFAKPEPLPEKPKKKKATPQTPSNIAKILAYCLPSTTHQVEDPLYQETKTYIRYGDKFSFEAIPVQSNDLLFDIWVNIPNINENSIIFVPQEKRWWKVSAKEEKNGGFVLRCHPSTLTPSFT